MEELYKLGINENTIKNMIELNPYINNMTNEEVKERIIALETIDLTSAQIRNVISSNALYLDKTIYEIFMIVNKLIGLGFKSLNILFDSNPYIFNLEPFEIDEYINERKNNGETLKDIVDDLESNPYLFNEI